MTGWSYEVQRVWSSQRKKLPTQVWSIADLLLSITLMLTILKSDVACHSSYVCRVGHVSQLARMSEPDEADDEDKFQVSTVNEATCRRRG